MSSDLGGDTGESMWELRDVAENVNWVVRFCGVSVLVLGTELCLLPWNTGVESAWRVVGNVCRLLFMAIRDCDC